MESQNLDNEKLDITAREVKALVETLADHKITYRNLKTTCDTLKDLTTVLGQMGIVDNMALRTAHENIVELAIFAQEASNAFGIMDERLKLVESRLSEMDNNE